jgi:hypothetical protein
MPILPSRRVAGRTARGAADAGVGNCINMLSLPQNMRMPFSPVEPRPLRASEWGPPVTAPAQVLRMARLPGPRLACHEPRKTAPRIGVLRSVQTLTEKARAPRIVANRAELPECGRNGLGR